MFFPWSIIVACWLSAPEVFYSPQLPVRSLESDVQTESQESQGEVLLRSEAGLNGSKEVIACVFFTSPDCFPFSSLLFAQQLPQLAA